MDSPVLVVVATGADFCLLAAANVAGEAANKHRPNTSATFFSVIVCCGVKLKERETELEHWKSGFAWKIFI